MKVAITGHTQGIGQALMELYQARGHQVIGFSRRNGYDITKPEDRIRIIDESSDCDLFFNNAHADFSQCDLLFELWQRWENQKKTIVNLSTGYTTRWIRWPEQIKDVKYFSAKIALEESTHWLNNQRDWPAIHIVSPCITDTPRVAHHTYPHKVPPADFAKYVYDALSQNQFRVTVLHLNRIPLD
jgi:NAD(P)-dependent dehydrogenase (short-subunit alcohol dehydrogenase family)